MALTLVTTAGAANANAYATLATVTTILEGIPNTAGWADVATENQKAAILHATWVLDNHVLWKGAPSSSTQALMWPRQGVLSRFGPIDPLGTLELDSTIIPAFLERATSVGAFVYGTTTRAMEQDEENMSNIAIPGLSVTLGGGGSSAKRPLIPVSVFEIIRDYAHQVQGYTARRVVRA